MEKHLFAGVESDRWQTFTPYPNLSPRFESHVQDEETVLRICADSARTMGQWRSPSLDAFPGPWRCELEISCEGIEYFETSVSVLVTWMDEGGRWLQRDYIDEVSAEGIWMCVGRTVHAPAYTASARIELMLRHSEGSVSFRKLRLFEAQPIPPRMVTLASACYRFSNTLNANRDLMCVAVDRAAAAGADIVCLSETMYSRGAESAPHRGAVPIPGVLTDTLGRRARAGNIYIVVSLLEEDDGHYYNTAVLIARNGEIIGKYRKTHLPLSEVEEGILPGEDIPVFDTDFGRVGMMICWDQMFPEVARILRIKGAEVIFLPTAGESEVQAASRAMENSVYVVMTHSYMESASKIIAPSGDVIARAQHSTDGLAVARVDLNKRYYQMWLSVGPCLGDTRPAFMRERRVEAIGDIISTGR